MEEDGRFRERAYERLYQLYSELTYNFIAKSVNMTVALVSNNLDPIRLKETLESFTKPKKYEYHGILSNEKRAEIRALEMALFGEASFIAKD